MHLKHIVIAAIAVMILAFTLVDCLLLGLVVHWLSHGVKGSTWLSIWLGNGAWDKVETLRLGLEGRQLGGGTSDVSFKVGMVLFMRVLLLLGELNVLLLVVGALCLGSAKG